MEVSLSFDNAVVNANRLETMNALWRRRFLTWGILIAVFGMRINFPLAIVSIAATISPVKALHIALMEPQTYSALISEAHLSISAFGGVFMLLVALSFFTDTDKSVHWVRPVERLLQKFGRRRGFKVFAAAIAVVGVGSILPSHDRAAFGLAAFTGVNALAAVLVSPRFASDTKKAGLGGFLYLDVIDASFSFDGIIGSFALTSNLPLIAIGLGIARVHSAEAQLSST